MVYLEDLKPGALIRTKEKLYLRGDLSDEGAAAWTNNQYYYNIDSFVSIPVTPDVPLLLLEEFTGDTGICWKFLYKDKIIWWVEYKEEIEMSLSEMILVSQEEGE